MHWDPIGGKYTVVSIDAEKKIGPIEPDLKLQHYQLIIADIAQRALCSISYVLVDINTLDLSLQTGWYVETNQNWQHHNNDPVMTTDQACYLRITVVAELQLRTQFTNLSVWAKPSK